MPGRLFLDRSAADLAAFFGTALGPIGVEPRFNISPGQEILTFDGAEIQSMRWGIIPVGRINARGRPVMETIINARSESVFEKSAFEGVSRVIVPADGWYEWTGDKRKKQPWMLRPINGEILGFAAIADTWTAPNGTTVKQVATVTCEPNEDVAKIHHRMGVILQPSDFKTWLIGDEIAVKSLMRPMDNGCLSIIHAEDVNWDGP